MSNSGTRNPAIELDVHEVVRRLNAHLGATLVAAATGVEDTTIPTQWAKLDGPAPGTEFTRRLRIAHLVWTSIADADGDDVARTWFVGGNPHLEGNTPLTQIRKDHERDVLAAAAAFVADQTAS